MCVHVARHLILSRFWLHVAKRWVGRSIGRSVCWGTHSMHSLSQFAVVVILFFFIVYTHPIWIRVSVLRSCMRVGYVFVCRIYINISSFIHDIGFYLFTLVFWLGLLFFYFKLLFSLLLSCVLWFGYKFSFIRFVLCCISVNFFISTLMICFRMNKLEFKAV